MVKVCNKKYVESAKASLEREGKDDIKTTMFQSRVFRRRGRLCPTHYYLPPPPGFSDPPTAQVCNKYVSMIR